MSAPARPDSLPAKSRQGNNSLKLRCHLFDVERIQCERRDDANCELTFTVNGDPERTIACVVPIETLRLSVAAHMSGDKNFGTFKDNYRTFDRGLGSGVAVELSDGVQGGSTYLTPEGWARFVKWVLEL